MRVDELLGVAQQCCCLSANPTASSSMEKIKPQLSPNTAVPLNKPPALNSTTLAIKLLTKQNRSVTILPLWAARAMQYTEVSPSVSLS